MSVLCGGFLHCSAQVMRVHCCAAIPVQGRLLCRYAGTGPTVILVPGDCSAAVPIEGPLLCRYSCTGRLLCRCACTGLTAIPVQDDCCAAVPVQDTLLFLYRTTAVPLFLHIPVQGDCRYSCTGPAVIPALPLFLYRAHCCAAIPVQDPLLCRCSCTGQTALPLFLYRAHCCAAIPVQGRLLCRYSCTGPTAVPLFPYRAQDKHRQEQR